MRQGYNKNIYFTGLATVAAVLQSGCQAAPGSFQSGYNGPAGQMGQAAAYQGNPYNVSPAAGPAPVSPSPYAAPMAAAYPSATQQQELESANMALKERVERVEKAMLRLDKRMQLVERGELGRMNGSNPAPQQLGNLATPAATPDNIDEQTAMNTMGIGPAPQQASQPQGTQIGFAAAGTAPSYGDDFQPVSTEDTTIRSSLQAAPPKQLASLADSSPAAGRKAAPATDVAVWTVRYDAADKVWPDRTQLPLSRDVVEALRAGTNVTLFARGPNPNAVQFRERVKALSRYLAKVTSQDNVPIAALPSPQLDANTIEILATH